LKAKVLSFEPLGSKTVVYLRTDSDNENVIKTIMGSDYRPKINQEKTMVFREKDLYLFDKISTELVFRF
jgi:hypothetical protein